MPGNQSKSKEINTSVAALDWKREKVHQNNRLSSGVNLCLVVSSSHGTVHLRAYGACVGQRHDKYKYDNIAVTAISASAAFGDGASADEV